MQPLQLITKVSSSCKMAIVATDTIWNPQLPSADHFLAVSQQKL